MLDVASAPERERRRGKWRSRSRGNPRPLVTRASRSATITSDHPVLVRIFAGGEGGRIVTVRDSAAMVAAIADLCEDPASQRHLAEGVREPGDSLGYREPPHSSRGLGRELAS